VFYGSIGNLRASFGNSLVNGFIDLVKRGEGPKAGIGVFQYLHYFCEHTLPFPFRLSNNSCSIYYIFFNMHFAFAYVMREVTYILIYCGCSVRQLKHNKVLCIIQF